MNSSGHGFVPLAGLARGSLERIEAQEHARIDSTRRHMDTTRSLLGLQHYSAGFQETPLANSVQARKRARQAEDRRQQNASQRSTLRTFMKKVIKAIQAGDKEAAVQAFKDAVPRIDRAARKGLIHANKAARHKSRMNAHIKEMG